MSITTPSTELALTEAQTEALRNLCTRYNVTFDAGDYRPAFDLPTGWFGGWVGGDKHGYANGERQPNTTIYVGVSPEGSVSS